MQRPAQDTINKVPKYVNNMICLPLQTHCGPDLSPCSEVVTHHNSTNHFLQNELINKSIKPSIIHCQMVF